MHHDRRFFGPMHNDRRYHGRFRRNPSQEVSLSVRHGDTEPARSSSTSPLNPRTMIGAVLVLAGAAGLVWQFSRPAT